MSDTIISVENLGKAYRIGLKQEIPDTIVGAMQSWIKAPLTNFKNLRRLNTFSDNGDGGDIIWALKDVSFEVKQGEVVGIIGRNGAGKSTLLKILSRITEPTTGRAVIHGRVSSLLEVGTGFHPELTGRENVYMNGTILGMRKKEIDRKFDEIVDFSGVEKFLDTPIKRYSSGMNVRLAFAVAAHLDPEILIIDEVLAVGDAEFQKKCLGKMQNVARGGRTVLFVSHNMAAVRTLCSSVIMLENGTSVLRGPTDTTVDSYLKQITATLPECNTAGSMCSRHFTVHTVKVESCDNQVIRTFDTVDIFLEFSANRKIKIPSIYLTVKSSDETLLCALDTKSFSALPSIPSNARTTIGFRIKALPLLAGRYTIQINLKDLFDNIVEDIPARFPFHVVDSTVYGAFKINPRWQGHVGLAATLLTEPQQLSALASTTDNSAQTT